MNQRRIARALTWAAAVSLIMLLGGNLYEQTTINPVWSSNPPQTLHLWRDIVIVNGIPFYILTPTTILLSWIAFATAWRPAPGRRKLLLIAAVCATAVLAVTFIVFLPILEALFRQPNGGGRSAAELRALADRFNVLSWLRWLIVLAGSVTALRATTVPFAEDAR